MIDIKRKVPRFNIKFNLVSNEIEAKGVNISQKGLGFLTDEELVPADNIPFSTEIEGYIFSNRKYNIKGTGRLLYSKPTQEYRNLYYNGFEFIKIDDESQNNLYDLLEDIRKFERHPVKESENKTLADFLYYPSIDLFAKTRLFQDVMEKRIHDNMRMFSYYLSSASTPTAKFINRKTKKSKRMIMLGSNNYLGLTTNKEVIQAGIKAMEKYGTGNGSGAMVGGTLAIHKELEQKLASFTGKEAVILFNSGYATNLGAISGLLRPNDAVINDQYNHASIIDGCTLSGAKLLFFSHNNVSSLKRVIKRGKLNYNGMMIVVDGIFSTDGSMAPLTEIIDIAQQYECKVMVDEAHALGILGDKGVGSAEYLGILDKTDIIMGTMSKSLAGVGGFIAANKDIIEYLRYYARSHLFSTTVPPAVAGSVLKALEIIHNDKSIRQRLLYNVDYFKSRLLDMGLTIGEPKAAIVPIFISDVKLLLKASARLFDKGIFHNIMTYPAVPMGGSLLRFGIMTTHTEKELNKALDAIEETAEKLELFKNMQKDEE